MASKSAPPTLKDVAAAAGVSRTTASMALSGRMGSAHLSAECVERVRKAAATLGYRGNYHARTLSSGRSYTLGLAVGTGTPSLLQQPFFAPICGGVDVAAHERGFDVLIIGGSQGQEPLERSLQFLTDKRIDALIVMRMLYWRLPTAISSFGRRVIMLEGQDVPQLPGVWFDDAVGIVHAVDHLAALGHRSIAWVQTSFPERDLERSLRQAALAAACDRHGIAHRSVLVPTTARPETDIPSNITRYRADLRRAGVALNETAVMCYNDELALAVIAELTAAGKRVPEEVSVIGFDDLYGRFAGPELTSISHELPLLGYACVELAIELLGGEGELDPVPKRVIPSRLVVRSSTAPPPA